MNKQGFKRLMKGVRQGAKYLKGLREPSEVHRLTVQISDTDEKTSELYLTDSSKDEKYSE